MREEMEELEEPEIWNDFVREVKKELLGGQLGGNRKEMWWLVRGKKIGLIDKRCSTLSDVGEEEAANVSSSVLLFTSFCMSGGANFAVHLLSFHAQWSSETDKLFSSLRQREQPCMFLIGIEK